MAEYFWDIHDVFLGTSSAARPMAILANMGGPKLRVYRAYVYPVTTNVATGSITEFSLYRVADPFSKLTATTTMILRNLYPVARDPSGPVDGRFRAVYTTAFSGTLTLPSSAILLRKNNLAYSGRDAGVIRWTNSEWNGHPSLRDMVNYNHGSFSNPIVLNDSEGLFFWNTSLASDYFSLGFTFSQEI